MKLFCYFSPARNSVIFFNEEEVFVKEFKVADFGKSASFMKEHEGNIEKWTEAQESEYGLVEMMIVPQIKD